MIVVKSNSLKDTSFYLAECKVDPCSNKLISLNNESISLRPKVMQVLVCLAENANQMVERKALIETIWQGNEPVGSRGITDAVWQLRKFFSHNEFEQPVIETVSRRGYIFKLTPELASVNKKPEQIEKKLDFKVFGFVNLLLIVAIAITVLTFKRDPMENAIPNLVTPDKIKSLNQIAGAQIFPRLSNDGKWVAYIQSNQNEMSLLIQEVDNILASPLTLDTGNKLIGFPAWSRDDSKLAYAIENEQGFCVIRTLQLFDRKKMDVESCEVKFFGGLAWSSNAEYLVFSDLYSENSGRGLILFNLKTKEKKGLTYNKTWLFKRDRHPLWVNDDQQIVFVRSKGVDNQDIFITDLNGETRQLTFLNSEIRGLSPGVNRESIIFSLVQSKIATLKELNLKSGLINPLYLSDNNAVFPSYSQRSQRLVFSRFNQSKQLATLTFLKQKLSTGERAQLSIISGDPYVSEHYPSYSPHKNKLAFISNQNGIEQVWIKNLSSGELDSLTQENAKIYGVNWSPDGRHLAFTMEKGEQAYKQIHIVDVETGALVQISNNNTEHAPPTWSEDGQSLFTGELHGNDFYLFEYHLDGRKKQLLEFPAIYGFRRANSLYYSKYLEKGVWLYDLVSKTETRIIENLSFGDGSNWKVTDTGIFFLERTVDADKIMFYDFGSAQTHLGFKLEPGRISKYENFDFDQIRNQLYLVLQPKETQRIYHVSYP